MPIDAACATFVSNSIEVAEYQSLLGSLASSLHPSLPSKMIAMMRETAAMPIVGPLARASPRPRLLAAKRLQRSVGTVRIGYVATDGKTRLSELYHGGAAKARFPRGEAGEPLQSILLNTAGGVTGGDHFEYEVTVGTAARAVVTTQAAERIYRRSEGLALIESRLALADGASLDWLPQETIVFDGSALRRSLSAEVAESARLLAVEAIVLGRTAMGEVVTDVDVADAWRISRGGRLVFADGFSLRGNANAIMAGRATGLGAIATATVVLVAPDADGAIDKARDALSGTECESGASAWNGMLVARLIAKSGQALRNDLVRLIEALRAARMPRVWNC